VRKSEGNKKVNLAMKTVTETTQHWQNTLCCLLYPTLNTAGCCTSEIRDELAIVFLALSL
jgi:hypothetical protein